MQSKRKMGFLEELTTLMHARKAGAGSISVFLRLKGEIDFYSYKLAWKWLFFRYPLLRAVVVDDGGDSWFDCSADFFDIPIMYDEMAELDNWQSVFQHIGDIEQFDSGKYLWRTSLISLKSSPYCYIVFTVAHSICDASVISHMLGKLLQRIGEIKNKRNNSDKVKIAYKANIPPPLDLILPACFRSKGDLLQHRRGFSTWRYQKSAANDANTRNCVIFRDVSAKDMQSVLVKCRRHGVTFTNILTAAYALSLFKLGAGLRDGKLNIYTAVDFRKYSEDNVGYDNLACYAHQVSSGLSVGLNLSVWELAKQAKKMLTDAINNYRYAVTSYKGLIQRAFDLWDEAELGEFFVFPCLVSNIGDIDSSFSNIDTSLAVEDFRFVFNNNHALYGVSLLCATLKGSCRMSFGFLLPVLTKEWVDKLADMTLKFIMEAIEIEQKYS